LTASDWQVQTLQALKHRYGCLEDSPTEPLPGNPSISRLELTVMFSACLNQIHQQVVRSEDWVLIRQLQIDLASELQTLPQQVDKLETRTATVADQSFAAITQLTGEAIFAASRATGALEQDVNGILSNRVRLNLNTSFTGRDRLRIRLQARNTPSFEAVTGTAMGRLGFEGDSNNEVEISRLEYRLPVSQRATLYLGAIGSEFESFVDTHNPWLGSSGRGAISRFGRLNPIYRQAFGTGVGLTYEFSEIVELSGGYIAEDADDSDSGLSGGPYGAIAQVSLTPVDAVAFGLTYIRSYNSLSTGTGSDLANDPFASDSDRVSANSYGVQGSFRVSPSLVLGGWLGWTTAVAADLPGDPSATILNYALNLAFPDLGQDGSLAGLIIGQLPKVIRNDLGRAYQDPGTALHMEAFYRFQVTDAIAVTPGVFVVTAPEQDDNNQPIYVGTIRTTFSF